MNNIIINSSMPRACSTLLQNILNQNPDFYATPTDGLIELLQGARDRFTNAVEFRASNDQDLSMKAYRSFCNEGMKGYADALSDKKYKVIKSRVAKSLIPWFDNFCDETPKIICMVRDLKNIVASLEKLYRRNPDKLSQWYIPDEVRGTTVSKRVDMYLKNIPLSINLDQIMELFELKLDKRILFIRAEDLSSKPDYIMSELYKSLGVEYYKHDFDNVEQTTSENDVMHNLDNNLHTIRNKVEPLKDDSEEILGKDICNLIDNDYKWYQEFFGYID